MAGFSRADLESFRDAEVPDLIGPGVRLLFVGINPGLWTAATQTHFAHPANRFYPALWRAGILERGIDPAAGMTDTDRDHLRQRGIGITNLVRRATARAAELTRSELREGGERLERLVREVRPVVVAVAGITAYRDAFGQRKASLGEQPGRFGAAAEPVGPGGPPWPGARLWVVPNPSGLNAHETTATLSTAYAAPAEAAGIIPAPTPPL